MLACPRMNAIRISNDFRSVGSFSPFFKLKKEGLFSWCLLSWWFLSLLKSYGTMIQKERASPWATRRDTGSQEWRLYLVLKFYKRVHTRMGKLILLIIFCGWRIKAITSLNGQLGMQFWFFPEVRKWGSVITHFLIYPNIEKEKWENLFFFFSFPFYTITSSLLRCYS